MKSTLSPVFLSALASTLALAACGTKAEPTVETFTPGMKTYLEKRGALCLDKSTWPIDVTERDVAMRSRDALQMPVLERLGLVTSVDANTLVTDEAGSVTLPSKRYHLTPEGQRFYLIREAGHTADGKTRTHGDFCAVKLDLDRVTAFQLVAGATPKRAVVTYTYRVDAPPWTRDADAERVFPAVARVIAGAGTAQLTEEFTLTQTGWVANELLEATAEPGKVADTR